MKIAVIDFKSAYSRKVKKMFDDLGVENRFFEHDVPPEEIDDYDGIVFTGSSDTVYEGGRRPHPMMLETGKPLLGICYGHQVIHEMLGGRVERSETPEHDPVLIETKESGLFKGLPSRQMVAMHHDDEVTRLAEDFRCIASEEHCRYGASENAEKKIYTVQFHPEAPGNDYGREIFENFIRMVEDEKK